MKEQTLELEETIKVSKDRGGLMGSMTPTGSLARSPSIRSCTQLVRLVFVHHEFLIYIRFFLSGSTVWRCYDQQNGFKTSESSSSY